MDREEQKEEFRGLMLDGYTVQGDDFSILDYAGHALFKGMQRKGITESDLEARGFDKTAAAFFYCHSQGVVLENDVFGEKDRCRAQNERTQY